MKRLRVRIHDLRVRGLPPAGVDSFLQALKHEIARSVRGETPQLATGTDAASKLAREAAQKLVTRLPRPHHEGHKQ